MSCSVVVNEERVNFPQTINKSTLFLNSCYSHEPKKSKPSSIWVLGNIFYAFHLFWICSSCMYDFFILKIEDPS